MDGALVGFSRCRDSPMLGADQMLYKEIGGAGGQKLEDEERNPREA